MKRRFSGLEFADQFLGALDRDLVADGEQYPAVALDRIVDFRTLITHGYRPFSGGSNQATCSVIYDGGCALFHGRIRMPQLWPAGLRNASASCDPRQVRIHEVQPQHSSEQSSS